MGALLKLIGIQKTPSQSLIKAPSADLIRSDNELVIPEPEEIRLPVFGISNVEEYAELIKSAKCNLGLAVAGYIMLVKLREHGFRQYPKEKVFKLLINQTKVISSKMKLNVSYKWSHLDAYDKPLPPRILRTIIKVRNAINIDGVENNKSITYAVNVSNVNATMESGQEICFLIVDTIKPDRQWSPYATVIDAWRGPTFSDEEAKI